MSDRLLVASSVLVAVGGLLTIFTGVGYWAAVVALSSVVTANTGGVVFIAVVAIIVGALLVFLSVGLWAVESPTSLGVVIVILSALTFYLGTAFVPAIILCVVGGLLAIYYERSEEEPSLRTGLPATVATIPNLGVSMALLSRTCPACGKPSGVASDNCPECGASLNSRL
jgi:hypothetical protein